MYHLLVTYLNVSPVCAAPRRSASLGPSHCPVYMTVRWHWPKSVTSGIIFTCIFIFCALSRQMFCVCCKTLMSCFQIITHWSHGQQKSLNISKYDCMYLSQRMSHLSCFQQLLRMFLNVMLLVLRSCTLLFCCCGFCFSLFFVGFDPPPLRYL